MMGELFNLDDYRRSRPQANLVSRLDSVAGPAIPVPYANLSKIPTKELQRIDRDYMFGRAEAIRAFEQEQLSS